MRVFSRGGTGIYRGAVIGSVGVLGRAGGSGEGAVHNTGGKFDSAAAVDVGAHAQHEGNDDLATERKKVSHLRTRVVVGLAMRGTASSQPAGSLGGCCWRGSYTERC